MNNLKFALILFPLFWNKTVKMINRNQILTSLPLCFSADKQAILTVSIQQSWNKITTIHAKTLKRKPKRTKNYTQQHQNQPTATEYSQ